MCVEVSCLLAVRLTKHLNTARGQNVELFCFIVRAVGRLDLIGLIMFYVYVVLYVMLIMVCVM